MKKFNNKILIISLLALVGIFVLTKVFRSPGRESNLDAGIFKIDTASVTAIRLLPQKDTLKELKLVKDKSNWFVVREDLRAQVQPFRIKNILATLSALKPERIAARKKEKWEQYNVDDSTSSEVIVMQGNDEQLRLKIGKENGGITYARVAGEDEVYALEGALQSQFDKPFNDWRNQSLLLIDKEHITKIDFRYPVDSGFVLEKKDKIWMIGDQKADSTKVERYFSKVKSIDHDLFADTFKGEGAPDVTVAFTNDSNSETVVKGWKRSFSHWVLNSSHQQEVYFLDNGPVRSTEIFVGKKKLLP